MNILKRTFLMLAFLTLAASLLMLSSGVGSGGAGNDISAGGSGGRITICHKTEDPLNPYVELRLPQPAVENGHGKHAGDIIPAPEGGCP